MATTAPTTIVLKVLPKEFSDKDHLLRILAPFRALRLRSLQIDPTSFSSTYEQELAFADARWEQRLRDPAARIIVALRAPEAVTYEDRLLERANWVGIAAVVESMDNRPALCVSRINGLWVDPSTRGRGLGRRLTQACFDLIEDQCRQQNISTARVELSVDADNKAAQNLYTTSGFQTTGERRPMWAGSSRKIVEMSRTVTV